MSNPSLAFDHIHLVSTDPQSAAAWYVDKLNGKITDSYERGGAPQVFVSVGAATLIIRGQRTGERAAEKPGLEWGVDHFGFRVDGSLDAYCAQLKSKGVAFTVEPREVTPGTRIAFITGPDSVSIELLQRD